MSSNPSKTLHCFSALWVVFACLAIGAVRAAAPQPIDVVASFSILADWVEVIGGDRVRVLSLVPRDTDAHVFRPTPAHVRKVAAARLIVVNGLGFEGWLQRLLTAADAEAPVVDSSDGITRVVERPASFSGHSAVDPHAWHSVPNAIVYATNIARALCEIDAGGCNGYRIRSQDYIETLRELDTELRRNFASVPPGRRKVITSHDAFAYLGEEYGVEFVAVQGGSTDTEAAARHVASLITLARRERIPLFLENINDPRLLRQIGEETGYTPSAELYSDALSAPDGPAATYIDLMRYNTNALVSAMLDE